MAFQVFSSTLHFFLFLAFNKMRTFTLILLTHFQMLLHTSYLSSCWKCTTGFHSSEVIPNIYLSKGKSHLMCKWLSISLYLRLNFTLTKELYLHEKLKQQELLTVQMLVKKLGLGILSRTVSSVFPVLLHVTSDLPTHKHKTEIQRGRWHCIFSRKG